MDKNGKKYYIGLDIGTDSVGWAATDESYSVLRFNGNSQWGVRLIDECNTADKRRGFRSARRRFERTRFRMKCLEAIFNGEISKKDRAFFRRLEESNLYEEDKSVEGRYSLFSDSDYTDKDYHKEYPTIYHLRRRLSESREPIDIRLLYLGVAHLVKNRGHFLFDSETIGNGGKPEFAPIWTNLTAFLFENYDIALDCGNIDAVKQILSDGKLTVNAKKARLQKAFSIDKNMKRETALISLLAGGTAKTAQLFDNEEYADCEKASFSLSSDFDSLEPILGDDFELIERLKAVYDWAILSKILGESNAYICSAKCDIYEQHRRDLKDLKKYVMLYCPEQKYKIFNALNIVNNYASYSGHTSKGVVENKSHEQKDFIAFIKKAIGTPADDKQFEEMFRRIELDEFMPKLRTKENSVIPMQLGLAELKKILENASTYFDFLNETDASGKSNKQKILDIFSFRIPYYVGPLNTHSDKAWLERTKDKIYPWNFEAVVDLDKSAENFIQNLTSKCTYLHMEDVLPKNSMLYCRFSVLNELNNLTINGKKPPVELKQRIYNKLFLTHNRVTHKMLCDFLKTEGIACDAIGGINGDFKSTLKPLRDLSRFNLSDDEKERIIEILTIFGDEKRIIKRKITSEFVSKLGNAEIDAVLKLKYKDWGNLSRRLLSGIQASCGETGELDTVIGFMWSTNDNLMQILSERYGFTKAINEFNGADGFKSLKEEIDGLYISPKVKRPIFQAMKIIEELVKINGGEPEKIFIEMARGGDSKKKKDDKVPLSRKESLLKSYKSLKAENERLYAQLESRELNEFRRDALYLYFTQMGKCMYTGEVIEPEDLFNKNLYDIDHIFPQSKLKDDSLDNRVLVKKTVNEHKDNIYPLPGEIQSKMKSHWIMLRQLGLISQKKFERLIRVMPLTDEELTSFIGRQLVETRQATKEIAHLLERRYSSEIVYVQAGLVSDFRQEHKFVKSRDVNDLHHAKDAYLNIVVGNVYNVKCTHNKIHFIKGLQNKSISLNKMFDYDTPGAWAVNGNASIRLVNKFMAKNNILVTRYSAKQMGGLFDVTIQKKGHAQVAIKENSPRSDIAKYGGYKNATATYFAIVAYKDKKDRPIKAFVPVNLYDEHKYIADTQAYLQKQLEAMGEIANELKIIIPCVKYNTLISVDGFRMYISCKKNNGKVLGCKPAMQLIVDVKYERYIKKISSYLSKCSELHTEKEVTDRDEITYGENVELYDILLHKLADTILNKKHQNTADIIQKGREKFLALSLYKQCYVLGQVLSITHCNSRTGDLTEIGGSKKNGTLTIGNKLPEDGTEFKIIYQSITGLFERERLI